MPEPPLMLLRSVASLKLTFTGLVTLLAGVLVTYFDGGVSSWWLVAPLLMLSGNLLGAICTDRRINRRGGLLVFHVALLAVFLLVALGRLTSYHGRIELSEGQFFAADEVQRVREGPWHATAALSGIHFLHGGFAVTYAPDIVRRKTAAWILVPGESEPRSFGDNVPTELAGYQFFTTSNKGFSAVLTWIDAGGAMQGAVNFPSYPLHEWRQERDWTTPGGEHLMLELVDVPAASDTEPFELNATSADGLRVAVRAGPIRRVLNRGDVVAVGGGTIRLEDVRLWMGYEIRREPLVDWVFIVAATGILGLAWHLHARGRRRMVLRSGGSVWMPMGMRRV